ncbi:hypothetical protein HA052_22895 [Chromobacterium haemolyticum]|uniref:Uncharacterized protein n=1 Tax=Chromobacterium fluminis TaxID=3044269 RepID=A0ABX0LLK1_9NEIS|nr:hypothetical protein [Chromobacterium haemolyticum]NHR08042.1 hypothetical protein [Chromobacterium haemolyticum]
MKLDTRSPLPTARPTLAGHPFHGLVKGGGLTLPNGQVINYSVTGLSTVLRVPGWDKQEHYDPTTGHRWLPYAIYQRAHFFSGCYLYARFLNNCDWLAAFGPADVWAVEVSAAGLTLECLNRQAKRVFALNWGAVADAFKPNTGWSKRIAAVSPSGQVVAMNFVRASSQQWIVATIALTADGATVQFQTYPALIAWPGYDWVKGNNTQLIAAATDGGAVVAACGATILSVAETALSDGGLKVTVTGQHRVGNVMLGRFRSDHFFDMPDGPLPDDSADIQYGVLQRPDFVWLTHPMYTPIDDGAVIVNGYVNATGLFTPYGVVDIVSGTGTLWQGPADNFVAVHPVTRQVIFDPQPISFA